MKTISLFMDVEDPINPLADDAALDFPLIFTECGVRGSFCLTGEKCRTLKSRGRRDVAEAYLPHSLGLHTNTHSFHPSTMELLADLQWAEGCEAAFETEKKGYDAFVDLIGRPPTFWGGGGNTWGPEITDAMKRLGIPAYVYALTQFPNEAVHKFNGVFAMPQALRIAEEDWAVDDRADAACERVLRDIEALDQPWIGVFVGHPTKLRYVQFWDMPYYAGRTPPTPEYATPFSQEVYDRSKANFLKVLPKLKAEVEIVGLDDALKLPWKFRPPTAAELAYYTERTAATIRGAKNWPIHYKGLDPELIVQKTMNLTDTLEVGTV